MERNLFFRPKCHSKHYNPMTSQPSTVVAVGLSVFLRLIRQICSEAVFSLHTGLRDQSGTSVHKSKKHDSLWLVCILGCHKHTNSVIFLVVANQKWVILNMVIRSPQIRRCVRYNRRSCLRAASYGTCRSPFTNFRASFCTFSSASASRHRMGCLNSIFQMWSDKHYVQLTAT